MRKKVRKSNPFGIFYIYSKQTVRGENIPKTVFCLIFSHLGWNKGGASICPFGNKEYFKPQKKPFLTLF
jgi:hypothetical protein